MKAVKLAFMVEVKDSKYYHHLENERLRRKLGQITGTTMGRPWWALSWSFPLSFAASS